MTDGEISIDEARQQLHDIIRKDVPFNDKARDAVELATQCLGTDNGHVTRIDRETDYWEAMITTDTPDGQTPPGLELNLTDTYCRETIEDEKPNVFHDASTQGWADDPAFGTRELHTYLGVPLIVDNEPYGTVCFVAEEPRSEPFSDAETWFAEHLTRLFEREFEREQVEAQLTSQTNFATVLNRILRHNFRNDISVIRGQTEVLANQVDEEPIIETVLSKIDNLIEFSQKARELEKTITESSERYRTEVGPLIEDITESVKEKYPSASISVEYDDDVHLEVLQSFDRAVEELIENAVKHSGDSPAVTVKVDRLPDTVEIKISDNGPGLPDNEIKVLETGAETPLTHGSGVGLWKAHWIVTSHDGSLDSSVTENGTTLTMTIPEKSAVGVQNQLTDLTRARNKYRTAFEKATDAITIIDNEGRIIDANDAAGRIFGLKDGELLGRSVIEFLPDNSEFDTEWQEFQASDTTRGTTTVVGADGVERTIEYAATPDIIPNQHLFISRDITERREREQQLEVAETVFQTTQEALFLADVVDEEEYRLNRVNEAFEDITQRSSNNIAGMTPRELLGDKAGAEVQSRFNDCVTNREPTEWEQVVPVDDESKRIWQVRLKPLIQDGEVTQLVGAMQNITERTKRERQLNLAETVFENTQDALFVIDVTESREFYVERVNSVYEELTGISNADIAGKTPTEAVGNEIGSEIEAQYRECVEWQETIKYPEKIPVDGESRDWETKVTPVVREGRVDKLVGAMRDVTEQ